MRYDLATQTWSTSTNANQVLWNGSAYTYVAAPHADFFPDRNSIVMSAVTTMPGQNVWEYRLADQTWQVLGATPGPNTSGAGHGEYDPVRHVMLMFGGDQVFQVDQNGLVTQVTTAPIGLGTMNALTAFDPKSGQWLVMRGRDGNGGPGVMYSWDPPTNTWRLLSSTAPPSLPAHYSDPYGVFGAVAFSIASDGVIAVVRAGPNNDIWLYKHDPTAGTPL
jgi:hypothetical protein